jgi:hypothetical protein
MIDTKPVGARLAREEARHYTDNSRHLT